MRRDALREYVQNSVDARASTVHVSIDGPVATVRDDGEGMDFPTLRRARRLGASDKGRLFNVGFRGIGIYAAFGMCERLRISTRRAGDSQLLRLTMDFGAMSRVLEQDRDAPERSGVALGDLLYEYTDFQPTNYEGDPDDHFTMVQLEGLQSEYRSQLSRPNEVQRYLLSVLPVRFPEDGYGTSVNEWMRDSLGLNLVRVVLRIGKEPEFEVAPLVAKDVHEPEHACIKDADGKNLAFMWYAMSTTKGQIPVADVSGFLLKAKGFTLGGRQTIKHLWPPVGGGTLYHHYTGEVHVLDGAGVTPNAARNGLEAGLPSSILFQHLRDRFAVLNSDADVSRSILRARDDLDGIQEEARMLSDRMNDSDESQFDLYHRGRNLLGRVEDYEGALTRLKARGKSGRGRATFPPREGQMQEVVELLGLTKEPRDIANRTIRITSKSTGSQRQTRPTEPQESPLPQVSLLRAAVDSLTGMGVPVAAGAVRGDSQGTRRCAAPSTGG